MDANRREPSWLKATIRGALIAAAVGGGLFVLSQALAPSQAHADTAASAGTASATAQSGSDDSLLGPALRGAGSTLGSTLGSATDALGGGVAAAAVVVQPASTAGSSAVSSAVAGLPAPVRATLHRAAAPAAHAVAPATQVVPDAVLQLPAAEPVTTVVAPLADTIDGVVAGAEQVPGLGTPLDGIAGQQPASAVLTPTSTGLDDSIGTVAGAVASTILQTGDAVLAVVDSTAPAGPAHPAGPVCGATTARARAWSLAAATAAEPAAYAALSTAAGPSSVVPADSVVAASVDASAPFGDPGTPLAPVPSAPGAGSGAAEGGSSGGNGPAQLSGALGALGFPAIGAGLSSLGDGDALPASPVFEHDSSPD